MVSCQQMPCCSLALPARSRYRVLDCGVPDWKSSVNVTYSFSEPILAHRHTSYSYTYTESINSLAGVEIGFTIVAALGANAIRAELRMSGRP